MGDTIGDPTAAKSFYNDAIEPISTARSIAPQDEIYALELATAFDAAERFAEAEWIFYEAMQLDPKSDSLPRYYEGHLNLWRGSPENAEARR
jgi:Flp pilus assembly protein TadD